MNSFNNESVYERRTYKRVDIGIQCLIYVDGTETGGVIADICEDGLGITLTTQDIMHKFTVGEEIMVTGLDEEDVTQFIAKTVRIVPTSEKTIVGARIINTREVEPYIQKKKVQDFIRNLEEN